MTRGLFLWANAAGLRFCTCSARNKVPSFAVMKSMNRWLLAVTAMLMCALPALAQRSAYDVKEMNFDLWCQEEAGYPADRCDKRTDQDEAAFEAYRSKVEAYEIPYLQQRDKTIVLDRDIIRGDPVDNPIDKDPAQQSQNPNAISTTTP